VILGTIGVWATEASTGVRPLRGRSMRAIRGADPGPCTGNWSYRDCSESEKLSESCMGATNEFDCDPKKACVGCDDLKAKHEWCNNTVQPWNAICSSNQNGTAPKGCGKNMINGKCSWNKTSNKCRCSGEKGANDCARNTAVREDNVPNNRCLSIE
jgi:hypothetical protein